MVCPYHRQATANFDRNLAAFAITQPALAARLNVWPPAEGQWLAARDGSLTHKSSAGWWQGCSLPLRAAQQQLKSMDVAGPLACFLDPLHAAHLRVALNNLKPTQAVLAIVLDSAALPVLLAADDFADDIANHRLWVVAGIDWPAQTQQLFDDQPGLPTPMQFVRLALPDAARLDPVIAEAQRIYQGVSQQRSLLAQQLLGGWKAPAAMDRRLCVVTGAHFRLGDDAAVTLSEAAAAASDADDICPVNTDDPASGATLALVTAALQCGALLTADLGRGDLPEMLPKDLPWATWMTVPRVPSAVAAGREDLLLVTDSAWRDMAIAAGWRAEAVLVAGWPAPTAIVNEAAMAREMSSAAPFAAIVSDTVQLDPPERLEEFSSHVLLWNSIRQELHADPFAAGVDAEAFLRSRAGKYGVDEATLDQRLFVQGLIWPATMQGMARRLLAEKIPIRLYGAGWADVPELASAASGRVMSRADLAEIATQSAVLIDARPARWQNWQYGLTGVVPVIRTAGRTLGAIRHDLSLALSGMFPASRGLPTPALSLSSVLRRLRGPP